MVTTDLPIHVSDALLPGNFETFELRMKLGSGHGAMTIVHVRAGDLPQAGEVGRKWCALHGARFIGVYPICVADTSILDEPATVTPLASRSEPESVQERSARLGRRDVDDEEPKDSAALAHAGRGRIGA